MDTANDMDIERAKNIELQGNGNSLKSNGKKTNNTTGVVGHQLQHHVDDPISVGSLNMGMLSNGIHSNNFISDHTVQQGSFTYLNPTENCNFIDAQLLFHDPAVKDRENTSFNVDSALGLEKTRLPEASGLELVGLPGSVLPLGRKSTSGTTSLADAPPPTALSPRSVCARALSPSGAMSPGSPSRQSTSGTAPPPAALSPRSLCVRAPSWSGALSPPSLSWSATAEAAAPPRDTSPAGAPGFGAARPAVSPRPPSRPSA
jgi:hypothetical protein